MSIFGQEHPKIVVNIDSTQDEIELLYSVVLKDEPELDTYNVKAVRTGKKVFNNAGKHWIFQVKIHLWKYADPKATYLLLRSYVGTDVYLYRRADGQPIYDTYGNDGVFFFLSMSERYFEDVEYRDEIILTFKSKNYISRLRTISDQAPLNYLRGAIDGTPAGSIYYGGTVWYEANHIGEDVKTIRGFPPPRFRIEILSGIMTIRLNYLTSGYLETQYCNLNDEIFSGIQNVALAIGFERKYFYNSNNNYYIFNHYSNDGSQIGLYIDGQTGYLTAIMGKGGINISATIERNYMDENWHIAIVNFDQIFKRIAIYTDGNYSAEVTNTLLRTLDLTSTGINNPTFGCRSLDGTSALDSFGYAGTAGGTGAPYFGDISIYFNTLKTYQINEVGNNMAARLGISW